MVTRESSPFGSLLRSYRVEAGLSQERLAEHAGLSLRGISDLERGVRRFPRLETVRMLADALNLSAEDRIPLFHAVQPRVEETQARAEVDSPDVASSSLPLPPTPLVGREREIATIVGLLEGDAPRLITLTGTGGVGKTRLALEIATTVTTAFPDGVCFVALAPVTDQTLVVPAIVDALGIRKSPGVSDLTALKRYLRSRRLLLVLDNFEHLLPAALGVADLLATCAGLKVLATSRVSLRLQGERQVPISPLGLPDSDRTHTLAEVAGTDAVQLFVARAQEVKPDFLLDDDNVRAIVDICRRLDGLPLALELAAVRVKILSPQALLRKLEHRLPLLTGGAQDQPARHQTLRATVAWSYDLLSPEEQALFRRLAVFTGGWTLDAAEAVIPPDGTLSLFEGLASLVDKSLAQSTDGFAGEPRYLMLETVREFASEQLEASGEVDELGRRHADYCLTLAQKGELAWSDVANGGWLAQMDAEQANLRAALVWLRDHELTHDGLRLATALGGFWGLRNTQAEGHAWTETFLARAEPTERSAALRITALRWLGEWAAFGGDLVTARAHLNESLALARHVDDKRSIYMGLGSVAMALVHHGDVAESLPHFAEAVTLAREEGDPRDTANLLAHFSYALGHQGELARAETLAAESLALVRSYGASHGFEATIAVLYQGWLAIMAADHGLAAERFAAALDLCRGLGAKAIVSMVVAGLAEVALSREQIDEASARYREGVVLGWEGKVQLGMVYNLQGLVRLASAHGEHARAARLAGALETFGNTIRAMPVTMVRAYEADVAHLRTTLGKEAFAAERVKGTALSPAEIVAEALAFSDDPPESLEQPGDR